MLGVYAFVKSEWFPFVFVIDVYMVECGRNLLDVKFRLCAEVFLRLSSALKGTACTYELCSRPSFWLVDVFLYTFAETSVEIGSEVAEVP